MRISGVPEPVSAITILFSACAFASSSYARGAPPPLALACASALARAAGARRSALVATTVRLVNSVPECLPCLQCVLDPLERFRFAAELEKRFAFQLE